MLIDGVHLPLELFIYVRSKTGDIEVPIDCLVSAGSEIRNMTTPDQFNGMTSLTPCAVIVSH